jgi:hypothetical protein
MCVLQKFLSRQSFIFKVILNVRVILLPLFTELYYNHTNCWRSVECENPPQPTDKMYTKKGSNPDRAILKMDTVGLFYSRKPYWSQPHTSCHQPVKPVLLNCMQTFASTNSRPFALLCHFWLAVK